MSILEVNNLTLRFHQKILIRDLSFRISEGSFLAVIGHNGCGKTTFFRSLLNLHPFEGNIFLNGESISSIPVSSLAAGITMLGQKNHIHFTITVLELVVMGCFRKKSLWENYDDADYEKARKVLALLQIAHLADKDYQELSGGEQQMVWLAQVMMQDSKILLLDEPTQHLDLYNKKKIFEIIRMLVEEQHKTVLCITHDLHNLKTMQGMLINLSKPVAALEKITENAIELHSAFLEK